MAFDFCVICTVVHLEGDIGQCRIQVSIGVAAPLFVLVSACLSVSHFSCSLICLCVSLSFFSLIIPFSLFFFMFFFRHSFNIFIYLFNYSFFLVFSCFFRHSFNIFIYLLLD